MLRHNGRPMSQFSTYRQKTVPAVIIHLFFPIAAYGIDASTVDV